jgi:hypothetical protein
MPCTSKARRPGSGDRTGEYAAGAAAGLMDFTILQ